METIFRRILTFVGVMLALTTVFAQEVDEATAQQRALNFLQKSSSKSKSKNGKTPAMNVTLAHTSKGDMGNNYYAYNIGKNEGFIVVSADEKAEEVLCYADEGKFDMDNMAPAMKWWMGEYEKQIQAAKSANFNSAQPRSQANDRAEIKPLIKSKWGQSEPYNGMTPMYDDIHHSPTGCVATAMAQIMYYHKYPEHGIGTHSYEWNSPMSGKVNLSVDFSKNTYHWDKMIDCFYDDGLSGYRITGAGQAVSLLMRDCGFAVDMGYGMSQSGAYTSNLHSILKNYFGFNEHTTNVNRTNYSTEVWEDILYNELANGRPIIYTGSAYNYYDLMGSGHAFICDGYSDGYFHFNLGWEGQNDGFFKVDAIQVNWIYEGNGYNCFQQATLCYPKDGTNPFSADKYTQKTNGYSLELVDLEKPENVYDGHCMFVKAKIKNTGERDYQGMIVLCNSESFSLSGYMGQRGVSIKSGEIKEVILGSAGDSEQDFKVNTTQNGNSFVIVDLLNRETIGNSFEIGTKELPSPITINGLHYLLINDAEQAMVTFNEAEKYEGDIVIPETVVLEGKNVPVTAISENAFYHQNCKLLSSISIPSSVERIGSSAFGNDCPKYTVSNNTPIKLPTTNPFSAGNAKLFVPNGAGDAYCNASGWQDFAQIIDNGNIVSNKIGFDVSTYGGGTVNVADISCQHGYAHTKLDVGVNYEIVFTPYSGNDVLLLQDVSRRDGNDVLDITNSLESGKLNVTAESGKYLSYAVFFGFRDNGLAYSIVSDHEAVVLCPSLYTGIGGYSGDIDIPASITRNGKTYAVGGIQKLALGGASSITLHWQEPIDISEDTFGQNTFSDATLYIPEGSAEKYLSHPVWSKFSKIVENGTVIKDAVSISFDGTSSGPGEFRINGVDYRMKSYSANKGEDVKIHFWPAPLCSLSKCEINGEDILGQLDKNNCFTLHNIQSHVTVHADFAMEKDGVWYNTSPMISYIHVLDDQGQYLYTDTTYQYMSAMVVSGIYKGDVVIPEQIEIQEVQCSEHLFVMHENLPISTMQWYVLANSDCSELHSFEIPKTIRSMGNGTLHDTHYKYLIVRWDEPIDVSSDVFYIGNSIWSDNSMFENATLMVPIGTLDKYKNHATWGLFKNIVECDDWRAYEGGYIVGDANNNGEVNVADITAVVSHIYGQTPANFNAEAADVNHNGEINVADITGIVSIIYGGSASGAKGASKAKTENVTLSIPSVTANAGAEVCVPIYIDNADAISAYQFDLALPENVLVKDVRSISDTHQCMGAYMEDDKYRVMSYSLTNEKFVNGSAPVGYITLAIDDDAQEGTHVIGLSSAVTSANGKDCNIIVEGCKLIVNSPTGISSIDNDAVGNHEVMTLGGVKINSSTKLPKGVYIVNGKKQVVR